MSLTRFDPQSVRHPYLFVIQGESDKLVKELTHGMSGVYFTKDTQRVPNTFEKKSYIFCNNTPHLYRDLIPLIRDRIFHKVSVIIRTDDITTIPRELFWQIDYTYVQYGNYPKEIMRRLFSIFDMFTYSEFQDILSTHSLISNDRRTGIRNEDVFYYDKKPAYTMFQKIYSYLVNGYHS